MKPKDVKFRGKSKRTGEWLYGDLIRNTEGTFAIVPPFDGYEPQNGWLYEVEEETIGQFTGKYDSMYRDIYEGDILMCRAGFFVVQIDTDAARFIATPTALFGKVHENEASFTLRYNTIWFSVVGNIYDNAELLK